MNNPTVYQLIKKFSRDFLRPYYKTCVLVIGFTFFSILLQLPIPLLTMYMIDYTTNLKDFSMVSQMLFILFALILAKHIFSYLNELITLKLREDIVFEIQTRQVAHIHKLPLNFFSKHHSTYLQSRVMNDSRAIEGALVRAIVSAFVDGVTFLVGISLILYFNYQLGLLLLLFLIPFAYIRYYSDEKMKVLATDMQEMTALSSAAVSENFAGIRTIKGYQRESFQQEIVSKHFKALRDIYYKTNKFGIFSTVTTSFITSMCLAFVIWYGCRSVLNGSMTIGEVFAVTSLLSFLYGPINNFVATNLNVQRASVSIQRIYEFLEEQAENDKGISKNSLLGHIQFKNVSFSYPNGNIVLDNVSFEILPGETVALVGRTGSGKSTLVNLLLGFYRFQKGQVLIDGEPIENLSMDFLRKSIGVVDQNTFLFNGTIFDNIAFGNPQASYENIVEASRKSFAEEFIDKQSQGYDSIVGERGVKLSGGQSQRIALARMFLKQPEVLILDEAVSAIDSESERFIQEALVTLTKSKTTIVIAHRLTSLLMADRVIVLDKGKIVEQGSHKELLETKGIYFDLFEEQINTQFERKSISTVTV
jgi:ABC-type multidrug transport system fused ATPase/permease subunit